MPPSRWSSLGFTLSLYAPLPQGGGFLRDLQVAAQDWEHTVAIFGGFDQAGVRVVEDTASLEDWFEEGLGRGVTAYDDAGVPMWEGFVNRVTLRMAGLEKSRGPLVGVVNRLSAVYSSIDTSTTPPTPGIRKQTGTVNDTASQARYGIWPQVLSIAGATDANAEQIRDSHLAEYAEPGKSDNYSPADTTPEVQLELLGRVHTLTYPYNQTTTSGTITLGAKLQAILAAQVNSGWVSSNYARITANSLAVPAWENDNQTALALIKGLVAMGDSSEARYGFGVYDNREAVYEAISSQVDYVIQLSDPARTIYDAAGAEIYPWRVRPGRWAFFPDFMPGRAPASTNLRQDPRTLLIEAVNFRLPWGVTLSGGSAGTLAQKLARLGLAGASS